VWVAISQRFNANDAERFVQFLWSLRGGDSLRLEDEFEVLADAEMRPKSQILKHEPNLSLMGRHQVPSAVCDLFVPQPDFTAVGLFETGNHPQECRFATAAGSQDNHTCPLPDFQRDRIKRRVRSESLGDAPGR
jgi:hypothetical protein